MATSYGSRYFGNFVSFRILRNKLSRGKMSFNIGVIGTGYVGIVSGSTFAETGNNVICVDIDEAKVEKMKQGISPIYEPGLERLLKHNISEGRLRFTTQLEDAVLNTRIIFLCLPTPPDEDGSADLQYVLKVANDIAEIIKNRNITEERIVVNKSTVPVGTADKVTGVFSSILGEVNNVTVCSNPEFLREGFAVEDAMKPERVVVGTSNPEVGDTMRDLYKPFTRQGNPIYIMDEKSAEVTKYAANSFLALKISYMNDLSAYCEAVGADIDNVRFGIGSDSRIGKRFLFAGLGYGGSCFPKDVQALNHSANEYGVPLKLISTTMDINTEQGERFVNKIKKHYNGNIEGKSFGLWGLAFKPNTDDTREAPAFNVIQALLDSGASVKVFDQEAMNNTKRIFGDKIVYANDMYDAIENTDALVINTEWNVFRTPNFDKIKNLLNEPIIFDGRNVYELSDMQDLGFEYYSIGRKKIGGLN